MLGLALTATGSASTCLVGPTRLRRVIGPHAFTVGLSSVRYGAP